MTIKTIVEEWTSSKIEPNFDYQEALKTLIENKHVVNQSINGYLHLDEINQDFMYNFERVDDLNKEYIKDILELINLYQYYIKMNSELEELEIGNINKLKKLNKILSYDFVEFLDSYLHLDESIISSAESLKIENNHQGVIKYYLKHDFKYAIETLETFFKQKKIRHDAITIKDTELTNNLLLKPKTKAYLKSLGERAYLKCLHFELLYNFEDITKDQSIDIINNFFDVKLEDTKSEHSFSAKAISLIKNNHEKLWEKVNSYYIVEFNENGSSIKKSIPSHIKEIKEIWNIQKTIRENFPRVTTMTTPEL